MAISIAFLFGNAIVVLVVFYFYLFILSFFVDGG